MDSDLGEVEGDVLTCLRLDIQRRGHKLAGIPGHSHMRQMRLVKSTPHQQGKHFGSGLPTLNYLGRAREGNWSPRAEPIVL